MIPRLPKRLVAGHVVAQEEQRTTEIETAALASLARLASLIPRQSAVSLCLDGTVFSLIDGIMTTTQAHAINQCVSYTDYKPLMRIGHSARFINALAPFRGSLHLESYGTHWHLSLAARVLDHGIADLPALSIVKIQRH